MIVTLHDNQLGRILCLYSHDYEFDPADETHCAMIFDKLFTRKFCASDRTCRQRMQD